MTFPIDIRRTSENPRPEIQLATETAMTVRMIMILLYGAGGVPGRGEIPMIQISSLFLNDFPKAICLARDIENKYCHDRLGNETVKYIVIFYWL